MGGLMGNTSEVYWEASGISLHQDRWSIKTWGGARSAPPGKRGDDLQIPFLTGRRRVVKPRDSRQVPLDMWILPVGVDGRPDPVLSQEQARERNWRALVAAMDVEDQFPLTKRWYGDDGSVLAATALAELVDAPEPTSEGGYRTIATFTLDLADPYFYGATVASGVGNVTILGDHVSEHVRWSLSTGQRVTTPDGNWVQYNGGGTAVLDVSTGAAKVGGTYVNGQVTRNTSFPTWPRLQPGAQNIAGAGSVSYEPAYW